jgi:hypothetical protein
LGSAGASSWGFGFIRKRFFTVVSNVGISHPTRVLADSRLKVNWAHCHILQLQDAINAYAVPDKHTVTLEFDAGTGTNKAILHSEPMPPSFSLGFGDAIHNLRAALDYAIFEILHPTAPPGEKTFINFPFDEKKSDLAKKLGKQPICRLNEETKALILNDIKPYRIDEDTGEKGNVPLWAMNKIDNIDKHRRALLSTALSGVHFKRIIYENPNLLFQENTLIAPVSEDGQILHIPPGRIVNADYFPIVLIRVDEPDFFNREPILPTLGNLLEAVRDTIVAIEHTL